MEWVTIDGSYGEGGGQILRSSVALSALTGKPLHIFNIRSKRKTPGLQPQHLTAVRIAASICDAEVEGARIRSMELRFVPTNLRNGSFLVDVSADQPSAGSGILVLQTVFPALLFAGGKSSIRIVRCGTHVPLSPSYDDFVSVFLPTVRRMGAFGHLKLIKAGWFPKGGGELEAIVQPVEKPLQPINLTERGKLKRVLVLSAFSNLKRSIAVRQANQAVRRLFEMGFHQNEIEVDIRELPSPSEGTITLILAECESVTASFSAWGELGKPAEKVADEAVDKFARYWKSKAPVDNHLADQLVLFMALSSGRSVIKTSELTKHTITNIAVIEKFLPVRFEVQGGLGEEATISAEGIGFLRQN